MKRRIKPLRTSRGRVLDIGASGTYVVPGAQALGPPHWVFPTPIPAEDNSVAEIHCYHFLEHLDGTQAIQFLKEVERVLAPEEGVFNFCVPYYNTTLAAQNLQHKSLWCEDTFDNLFYDTTYEHSGHWELRQHVVLIVGLCQRNLCLMGQLVKDGRPREERDKFYYPAQ
jgi:hypothetical protein